nr:primosomal protein N' [Roseospirillum parvum]
MLAPGSRVAVLLPLPLAGAYDYVVGPDQPLAPGQVVEVPLGRRRLAGVVWGPGAGAVEAGRLKPTGAVRPVPPLTRAMRALVDWVAAYTLSPPGAVLKMVLAEPAALTAPPPRLGLKAAHPEGLRLTEARQKILAAATLPLPAAELARRAGTTPAAVQRLKAAGGLIEVPLPEALPDWPAPPPGPTLSPDQAAAAQTLGAAIGQGFAVTLLEGVTGSGKTEVYFEAIARALEADRQVLVLVPEIALTAPWLARFEARFGAPPAVWHSGLGKAARKRTWRAVAEGTAAVVVGARSALFLPFARPGLIIVDEEHEAAFKQEDGGVIYQARDMAVVRGRMEAVPVILASATPSLETRANVAAGRYGRVHLPERHGGARLPTVALVDLKRHPPGNADFGRAWLAAPLVQAITETLAEDGQVMLFLNRRGYAPLTLCRACGHRLACPTCTAWLVEHRRGGRLMCHHCGHQAPRPETCPACGAVDSLIACGPGVERLAEEVAHRFPEARQAVAASDTLGSPEAVARLLDDLAERRLDVVIGTQVLAKGHHIPGLTLVGVVDGDLGLGGADLRAGERTWQMLHQVAGRAGRAERPGRVLIQTHLPDHPLMQALAAGDDAAFLELENESRRLTGMPPYGRLAAIIVSAPSAQAAEETAMTLAAHAPRQPGIEVLGPAEPALALLRGRHRRRLLIKCRRDQRLQPLITAWLAPLTPPPGVRVTVDVDPYSFA